MRYRNSYLKIILLFVLCSINSAALPNNCEDLSVNGADGWYPYFDSTNLSHLGIMGDIVSRAADRSGLKVNINPSIPWKRILFKLRHGDLDIIAGALRTPQREKQFQFSVPVHFAEIRVFVHKDRHFEYNQMSDLVGRLGGRVRGMRLDKDAEDYAFENLVIDDVPSPNSLIKMVASGRLDYGIFYWLTGKQEIKRNNLSEEIAILPNPISKEGLYIAYSKNSLCQIEISKLNDEIQKMRNDGSIEDIIQYYQSTVDLGQKEQEQVNDL